jgi:hypothetical protein
VIQELTNTNVSPTFHNTTLANQTGTNIHPPSSAGAEINPTGVPSTSIVAAATAGSKGGGFESGLARVSESHRPGTMIANMSN